MKLSPSGESFPIFGEIYIPVFLLDFYIPACKYILIRFLQVFDLVKALQYRIDILFVNPFISPESK